MSRPQDADRVDDDVDAAKFFCQDFDARWRRVIECEMPCSRGMPRRMAPTADDLVTCANARACEMRADETAGSCDQHTH
jgi:hypothetical protein